MGTIRTITIQPGQHGEGMGYNVMKPLPYPFHIDVATGNCTRGRGTAGWLDRDPTGHTPWKLLGFQSGDIQELVLTLPEFVAEPERAVGLVPVFLDWKGSIFALTVPITAVSSALAWTPAAVTR